MTMYQAVPALPVIETLAFAVSLYLPADGMETDKPVSTYVPSAAAME